MSTRDQFKRASAIEERDIRSSTCPEYVIVYDMTEETAWLQMDREYTMEGEFR